MKKTLTALLTALTISSSAFIISTNTAFAAPPANAVLAKDQVLNYDYDAIGTLDPSKLQWESDFNVGRMQFDTLLRLSANGEFIPSAAESYTVSDDGLVWTFKLRKNATWSDGKPVLAKDYVYSWRRLDDPKTAAPYAYYLDLMNVKNAADVATGKLPLTDLGIKALDDYTVQVTLSRPTPWLASMITLHVLAPLRQDIIEKWGSAWTQPEHIVVNGPFKVVKYRINDTLNLVKNPLFWDAKNTTLTNINIDFIRTPLNTWYGYLQGKYLTAGLTSQTKTLAFKDHKQDIFYDLRQSEDYLIVNDKTVPDVNVRKALALLIDRRTLTSKILKANNPTTVLAPKNLQGGKYIEEEDYFNQPMKDRIKEANDLLTAAGYSKDNPLKLKYLASDPKTDRVFVALQSWYKSLTGGKILVSIDVAEGKIFYERVQNHQFDIVYSGWTADYPQVTTFLSQLTCGNIATGINSSYYCNKDYDKLLTDSNNIKDPDERAKVYAKATHIADQAFEYIPLDQTAVYIVKNPRLQGYNPFVPFRYWQDFYILKDEPQCYKDGGDTLCATDLKPFFKNIGYTIPTLPADAKANGN